MSAGKEGQPIPSSVATLLYWSLMSRKGDIQVFFFKGSDFFKGKAVTSVFHYIWSLPNLHLVQAEPDWYLKA